MARLRVFSPDGPQALEQVVPLDRDTVVIGRDATCDLILQGTGASRRHAVLQRTATGWMLVDQGSSNGTFVLGQRVISHGLRHGDAVQMGDSRLIFEDGADPAPRPVAAPAPRKRGGCLGCLGCGCLLLVLFVAALATFILWRAGGIEGLTRRSIHTLRLG